MRGRTLLLLGAGLLTALLALATIGPALAQGRPGGPGYGPMHGPWTDDGARPGPGAGPMMGGRGPMMGGYGQMGSRGGPMMGQPLDQLSGDAFDRAFLTQMTMHHAMGVAMTRPIVDWAQHPELKGLANGIIAAQTREITQMRGWLSDWYGVSMPDMLQHMDAMPAVWGNGQRANPGSSWHGMGMGMMGDQYDQPALRREAVFMSLMVPHHQDAIDMANLALSRANHQEVKDLAQAIIQSQTAENQQMQSWLAAWFNL
jgi:uncharacterized protein (DUF305 family)